MRAAGSLYPLLMYVMMGNFYFFIAYGSLCSFIIVIAVITVAAHALKLSLIIIYVQYSC